MNKLSKKEKFCYGLGDLSSNIVFAAISFYLLYFMINVADLSPALASIVLSGVILVSLKKRGIKE